MTTTMTYSIDFHRKVLSVQKSEKLSFKETAERFQIGIDTVTRWHRRIEPQQSGSRRRKIDKEALLRDVELPEASIVVMDNATFHKRQDTQSVIREAGHILEFLPTYSPDLNPIEHKWAQVKSIRRATGCSTEELFKEKPVI